jgi:hypothetical protein
MDREYMCRIAGVAVAIVTSFVPQHGIQPARTCLENRVGSCSECLNVISHLEQCARKTTDDFAWQFFSFC